MSIWGEIVTAHGSRFAQRNAILMFQKRRPEGDGYSSAGSRRDSTPVGPGWLKCSRKYFTISSTSAARVRGKIKRYFGPLPADGTMLRLSERNLGSCATIIPSRSIVRVNERPPLRATNNNFLGSSLMATSAPKRFAGIFGPRPLMQGRAQAVVSPRIFWRLKSWASRFGKAIGNFGGRWREGGVFWFFLSRE